MTGLLFIGLISLILGFISKKFFDFFNKNFMLDILINIQDYLNKFYSKIKSKEHKPLRASFPGFLSVYVPIIQYDSYINMKISQSNDLAIKANDLEHQSRILARMANKLDPKLYDPMTECAKSLHQDALTFNAAAKSIRLDLIHNTYRLYDVISMMM